MEEPYDEELFIRPDGKPMVFCLMAERQQGSEYRRDLVREVELRGGVVLDRPGPDYNDSSTIRLLGRYENHNRRDRTEMFDYRYVSDCVQKNQILENMLDYRVSQASLFQQQYESYDPLDVLHGYKTWSQLPRDEGERVSDIEDDFETSSMVSSMMDRTRTSSMKTFKSPYTRRNQEEIVRALVRFAAYRLVRGNTIWKKLEEIGICNGIRTWQSMKEHFRKKIIQNIHDFGLTWPQIRRFRATYGLDQVRDSDVDSDEEEGVDSEARSCQGAPHHTTQSPTNPEKTFRPRRTSSPVIAGLPAPAPETEPPQPGRILQEDSQGEKEEEEEEGGKERRSESPRKRKKVRPEPRVEPEPSTSAGPVIEKSPQVTSSPRREEEDEEDTEAPTNPTETEIPLKPSREVSDKVVVPSEPGESSSAPEEETEKPPAATKRSGKRKRKLFSNNNSYLNDDGNSNNVENSEIVSPSRKRRVLSTLDETQEEEFVSTQKSAQMDIDAGKIPEVIMNDAIDHQDTMEEVFGPGVSPLCLSPAKRKSKLSSEESVSGSDSDKTKAGRNKDASSERRLKSVTKDKQGKSTAEASAGSSRPDGLSSTNRKNVSADSCRSLQLEPETMNRRKSSGSIDSREGCPSVSGSETNKENLNRSYSHQAKHRSPFSRGEEEAIVNYFLRAGGYSTRGGNTVWKKMEEEGLCPGRSWHSLKERFDKHIEPALHKFGVSRQRLLDRDRDLNKTVDSDRKGKRAMRNYNKQEDLKIINFICENKRFADVKGNELWKLMEGRKVVEGRTWQSLKERYRKIILKNINNYKLDKDVVAMFSK